MADKFPMPGQNDFSADEERSMRAGARADNARLSQVAPEFEPAAAQDARDDASARMRRAKRRPGG